MPLTSVLVINGGYGMVNETLSHGIPVIAAGMTEDKPEVGARVSRAGVGLELRSSTPSEAEIRAAVRKIIDQPTFLIRAQQLAAIYSALDAGPVAADLIEELAESPGGQQTNS